MHKRASISIGHAAVLKLKWWLYIFCMEGWFSAHLAVYPNLLDVVHC